MIRRFLLFMANWVPKILTLISIVPIFAILSPFVAAALIGTRRGDINGALAAPGRAGDYSRWLFNLKWPDHYLNVVTKITGYKY